MNVSFFEEMKLEMIRSLPGDLKRYLYKYLMKGVVDELLYKTKVLRVNLDYLYLARHLQDHQIRAVWYGGMTSRISWGYVEVLLTEGEYYYGSYMIISYHNLYQLKKHVHKSGLQE